MARAKTIETDSSYYPPRARWYSPLFRPWFQLSARAASGKNPVSGRDYGGAGGIESAVAGLFAVRGQPEAGGRGICGRLSGLAGLLCRLAGISDWRRGFGLMISIHASSIIFLESCALRDKYEFGIRFPLAIATLLVVWLAVYRPVAKLAEANWWRPMLVQGQVMVMKPAAVSGLGQARRSDAVFASVAAKAIMLMAKGRFRCDRELAWDRCWRWRATHRILQRMYFRQWHAATALPHMPATGEVRCAGKSLVYLAES